MNYLSTSTRALGQQESTIVTDGLEKPLAMASGSREVCRELANWSRACKNGGRGGVPISIGDLWASPDWFGGQVPIGPGAEQCRRIYWPALNDLINTSPTSPTHTCLASLNLLLSQRCPRPKIQLEHLLGRLPRGSWLLPLPKFFARGHLAPVAHPTHHNPLVMLRWYQNLPLVSVANGNHCDYLYNFNLYS